MTDASVDEVLALEERRWQAIVDKDVATLDQLFADEVSYTHSNALVDTKASYLAAIAEKRFDYSGVDRTDTRAVHVGDTVLLTGRAEFDVVAGGRRVHLNARYSVVWAEQDGRWKFFSWQSTAIP